MDNRTLIVSLIICFFISAVFTILTALKLKEPGNKQWMISSILFLTGFILLSLQNVLNSFFTVIISNYLILSGSYYQISAATLIKYNKKKVHKCYFPAVTFIYSSLFVYFTYFTFSTSIRVIIISGLLTVNFIYGSILLSQYSKKKNKKFTVNETNLFVLFSITSIFYFFRLLFTIDTNMALNSLFHENIITSVSFIFSFAYQLSFTLAMFRISLNNKTRKLIMEKEKMSFLFSFLNNTAPFLDTRELYPQIDKILSDTLRIDGGGIFLSDITGSRHSLVYFLGRKKLNKPLSFSRGEGVTGMAIDKNEIIETGMEDYPKTELSDIFQEKGVQHIAAVPIRSMDKTLGAITIVYTSEQKKSFMDREFFTYLGEQLGIVMQNAMLHQEMKKNAHTDPLTGLMNRRKMIEVMANQEKRHKRYSENFCIAISDIDHFKNVNDSYGHDCGDKLLKELSSVFRQHIRDTDYVSRWGGEEFLFMFTRSGIEDSLEVLSRMMEYLHKTEYDCSGKKINTTASFGITEFKDKDKIEDAISRADRALYMAKEGGRDRIVKL